MSRAAVLYAVFIDTDKIYYSIVYDFNLFILSLGIVVRFYDY